MTKSLRIAIADDDPEIRQYFAMALERLGHKIVVTAANGRELVAGCRRERPELLVTDIRMDELSGIEAMQELAKEGPMPTILISAHYCPEDLDDEVADQVLGLLTKPIKLASLTAAVAKAAEKIS
jgi:DNA-binding NtrC family response regulator